MSIDRGKRADLVIERYKEKGREVARDAPFATEVAQRKKWLAEVPALSARIDRAIAEFNERAADTSLRVAVAIDQKPNYAEIRYKIYAAGLFDHRLELSLTVDSTGVVTGFISGAGDIESNGGVIIWDLDYDQIFDMILALVEKELDLEH